MISIVRCTEKESDDIEWDIEDMKRSIIESAKHMTTSLADEFIEMICYHWQNLQQARYSPNEFAHIHVEWFTTEDSCVQSSINTLTL